MQRNDPDSLLFPTAKVNTGIILPVIVTTDCNTEGADIAIRVVKDGSGVIISAGDSLVKGTVTRIR